MSITELLGRINAYLINPFILLLFTVATVIFVWGIVKFLASDEGGEEREQGKRNIFYGLLGLFIMVSVYGIIQVVMNTIGVDTTNLYIFGGESSGEAPEAQVEFPER